MKDKKLPACARVSAARSVLDFGMRGVELEDLRERIEVNLSKKSLSPKNLF
jgi:uncharacterized protein with ATP-grasp and redox domains